MNRTLYSLMSGLLAIPCIAFADKPLADLPGHPPTPQYVIAGLNVSGYIAGSYNYLSQSQFFTSGVLDRQYDLNPNGFTLQQANLTIAKQPEQGWGALLDVILGRDAYKNQSYGMDPALDSQNAGLGIDQLFLQYAFHSVTVIAGKYFSLAGYESSLVPQDPDFSGSLIATFSEPTTVTGIRTTYAVDEKLSVIAGLNNGWDSIRDWSRRKTLELGTIYTVDKYTLSTSWYNGQERANGDFTNTGPTGIRNLVDLIATLHVTDKLSLTANYDFVSQNNALLPNGNYGSAVWQGIAGYIEYQWNEKWRTTLRGEYFNDRNGFATGVPQSLKEATVTVGYLVMKHFELRAETRRDVSNTNSFQGKNGESTSNNMQSVALEGVVTF